MFGTAAVVFTALSTAVAQSLPDEDTGPDPTLPIPTMIYERPPPDFSWEIALQGSYGAIVRWQDEIPPWIGFGLRAGWGRNIPDTYKHRIGVNLLVFAEGPMPIHATLGVEPMLSWDYISKSKLWLGAGIGGAVLYHTKTTGVRQNFSEFGVGAAAEVRIGYSQTWSKTGRRMFIGVAPKVRYIDGRIGPSFAVIVGSGKGY